MSERKTRDTIAINPVYDNQFRGQVEEGKANPLTGVKIRASDEYILGSETTVSGTYLGRTLKEALEMIDDIEKGDTCVLEFANGPTFLVVEPDDSEHITLTGCLTHESAYNPDQRRASEDQVVISKHAWVCEILRATNEFLDQMLEVNRELRTLRRFEELKQAVDDIEEKHC